MLYILPACGALSRIRFGNEPVVREFLDRHYEKPDGYEHYQVGDNIVSITCECEETDPCRHGFLIDGLKKR